MDTTNSALSRKVFVPFYSSLVAALNPTSILEVGIGTGNLALEMSKFVTRYVGIDASGAMIREAGEVLKGTTVEIVQSRIEDLCTTETFDLVLSHMCLQTIEDPSGFLMAIAHFTRAGGVYIIAIPHPAFFNDYKRVIPPERFGYMDQINAEIDFSITLDPQQVIRGVPYTHRSLSRYFSELNKAGLSVLYFNEMFPSKEVQDLYGARWQAPRYLVFGGTQLQSVARDGSDPISYRLLQYR